MSRLDDSRKTIFSPLEKGEDCIKEIPSTLRVDYIITEWPLSQPLSSEKRGHWIWHGWHLKNKKRKVYKVPVCWCGNWPGRGDAAHPNVTVNLKQSFAVLGCYTTKTLTTSETPPPRHHKNTRFSTGTIFIKLVVLTEWNVSTVDTQARRSDHEWF